MRSKKGMGLEVLALAIVLLSSQAYAHPRGSEKLPAPPVTMQLIAPSAAGPWLLRVDNEAPEPIRLAADARLLTIRLRPPRSGKRKAKATVCRGPLRFGLRNRFVASRELIVPPGHSYVQQFDPRLLCFGKKARFIHPGTKVEATLGWKPQRVRRGRMQRAPFVIDAAKRPRKYRPLKRLVAKSIVLNETKPVKFGPVVRTGGKGKQPRPPRSAEEASEYHARPQVRARKPKNKDELAAALTLTTTRYVDANHARDVALSVEAHNTGDRAVLVALRARQLSFEVRGPDGVVACRNRSRGHRVPRDLFRTLPHGRHIHMHVRLAEVCPMGTFARPGLYVVRPTLHADASGVEYGIRAATGVITTREPGKVGGTHRQDDDATVLRIRRGSRPFYGSSPKALPTRALR